MDRTRSSKALANPEYSSLTDKEDLLGCALLDMLSRGAALIAEIHRLGDRLPREAFSEQDYLFSFEDYFKDPERNETKLNRSARSVQADEEFQSKYYEFLERFFNVCAGIVRLAADFNRVTRDLRRGFFLSHSLEQALLDPDGKQWIPECMHLIGASLLLLNERFPGKSRERLIVAQYRMRGEASLKDFDQVVALVRDVEMVSKASSSSTNIHSPNEQLLARLNIDGRLARAIVSRIQADDIYGHTRAWPLTEHRSTALANQASIIYTALLFTEAGLKSKKSASDILPLSNGRAEMREIIDKHFSDQWVVVVCTGYIVDLEHEWSYYPAAKIALADVVSRMPTLRSFNKTQAKRVQSLLDEYLTRGVLTERYVTDHWDSLLEVLREANVTLRWRFLHGKTKAWTSAMSSSNSSSTSAQAKDGLSAAETIRLLLATAQLEHVLREAVRRVLDSKDLTWKTCRERVSDRMKELAQYFSGQVPLAKVQKDEELMKWFQGLGEEVAHLQYQKTPTATGRRVQALIKALEEVEKFDGVDASLQVREFLSDSRSLLEKMVRTVNVREEILVQIDVVSDLSYAWGKALEEYDLVWHDRVRQDPSSVGLLRAVFLKLTSVLDSALSRVAQAGSPDVDSVAEYWSRRLVAYVKRVLEVVPQSVCAVLDSVGEALEKIPDEGISRYQLNELGVLAAGEARYELAKCTHKIAVFTGGVLTMGKCVLGVVEVDPKRVLEDGLRQELRRRMLLLINQYSPSSTNTESNVWRSQLTLKAQEMKRLKRAFEYVQDYLTLDGTRTWNEELAKVVSVNTSYLREVLLKQLSFVDWTNERSYFALLDDLLNLIGVSGLVCLEALIGLEMRNLTLEFTKNSRNCELALSQLNLPAGVVWGSHNWVDSVREARRRYPSDQMELDFKRLTRIGAYFLARSRIRFYLEKEAKRDAPLLSFCVENLPVSESGSKQLHDNSSGTQAQFHLLSVSLGITVPIPSVPQNSLEDVSVVRRTFILMNELTKRIVSDNLANGVFSNLDFFYCCAGVASFCHAKLFVEELERCVFASARALCQKSLVERQNAESAIVFKFGAQKVAKVAMERLVTEQTVHKLIANLAKMPPDSVLKRAPLFIERIGEMWCSK